MTDQIEQDIDIETSYELDKIAEALSAAQGEMPHAELDGINTFFKKKDEKGNETPSKYATLKSLLTASKEPLSKNGLSVAQVPVVKKGKSYLCILLMHKSGQWLRGYYPLIAKAANDPQSLGAAMTYARRHGLGAMVGLAPEEDDDGNFQNNGLGDVAPVNRSGNKIVDKWCANVCRDMGAETNLEKLSTIYNRAKSEEKYSKLSNDQTEHVDQQYENRVKYIALLTWVDAVVEDIASFKSLEDLDGYMADTREHGNTKLISKEMGSRIKDAYVVAKVELDDIPNFEPRDMLAGG